MVSLSTCSPPALLWTSVCLLWCVCILFWGHLANGGNVKRLQPTSGGGNTITWTWSAVGWVNLNQMMSPSHSPGIKTAFYLIFPTTIRQFISIQTLDGVCLLRLHAGKRWMSFSRWWTGEDVTGGTFWEWWKNAECCCPPPLFVQDSAGILSPWLHNKKRLKQEHV